MKTAAKASGLSQARQQVFRSVTGIKESVEVCVRIMASCVSGGNLAVFASRDP
jgi:hypothetical protein